MPARSSDWIRFALPLHLQLGAVLCLSAAQTVSAASPGSSREFCQSSAGSPREATYFVGLR